MDESADFRFLSSASEPGKRASAPPASSDDSGIPVLPTLPGGMLLPGTRLGAYVIEGPLGRGGMGFVYRARHVLMGRLAALKVLSRGTDERARIRFLREACVAGRFRHPAVVEYYDFAEDAGVAYLAMELVPGQSLANLMRLERLSPARVGRIFGQVLEAVAAAHKGGVIHRDLKPSNVMVLPGDAVKVLDFGLARILEAPGPGGSVPDALTQVGDFVGTPAYAAPEQIRGTPTDERADIYQVAIMLFEALAGRLPFEAKTRAELIERSMREPLPRLAVLSPGIPGAEELDRVIARGAAKDPGERFRTALELRTALLCALPSSPGPELTEPPSRRQRLPRMSGFLIRSTEGGARKLFVFFGARLAVGRCREHGDGNQAILRVLPCRDAARDAENWNASLAISRTHGELEIRGEQALFTDRSSLGTTLCDRRLAQGRPAILPDRFTMVLGGGCLSLEGRVVRSGGEVEALVITRLSNTPEHAYALVARAAGLTLTPAGSVDVGSSVATGLGARISVRPDGPVIEIPAGAEPRPFDLGLRAALGPSALEVHAITEQDFLASAWRGA